MAESLCTDQYYTCPDCKNQFVQPFKCTTCGAQKLYDETFRSQAAQIERLQKRVDSMRNALQFHRLSSGLRDTVQIRMPLKDFKSLLYGDIT